MSSYREYTLTRNIPIRTEHVCSRCGYKNVKKQWLTVKSKYDDQFSFSGESLARRRDQAVDTLDEQTMKVVKTALEPTVRNYYRLDLSASCDKCGNREPWNAMRVKWLNIAFYVLSGICVLGLYGIISMIGNPSANPNYFLIILMYGLWLVSGVMTVGRRLYNESRIRKLPPESLPKITLYGKDAPNADPVPPEEMSPAKRFMNRNH